MIIYSTAGNLEINDTFLTFKDKMIFKDSINLIETGKYVKDNLDIIINTKGQNKNSSSNYVVIYYEKKDGIIDSIAIPYSSEEDAKLTSNTLNSWLDYGTNPEY